MALIVQAKRLTMRNALDSQFVVVTQTVRLDHGILQILLDTKYEAH
jgi:hypothetical protein